MRLSFPKLSLSVICIILLSALAFAETFVPVTVESMTIWSNNAGVSTGRGDFSISYRTADGELHTRSSIDGSFMAFGSAFSCRPCQKATEFAGSDAPQGTIPAWNFVTNGSPAQPIETALFSETRIFYPEFSSPIQLPYRKTRPVSFPVWLKGQIKIRNEQTGVTLVDSESALSGRAYLYYRRSTPTAAVYWQSYTLTLQRDGE